MTTLTNSTKFWRRPPPPTWRDLRALSLLVPAVAATLGGIAYSLQGIAATQAGSIPDMWTRLATEYGAVLLAIGCEGGTLSALAEIARKRRDGDTGPTDRWAGWVSFAATVFARLLALADLRALWSIALLVLLSSADIYALLQEAGEYLALHDRNMERYLTARHYYEVLGDLHGAMAALRGDVVMPPPTLPVAHEAHEVHEVHTDALRAPDKRAWLTYARTLDGRSASLCADDVAAWLAAQGMRIPARRTLQAWAHAARMMHEERA